MTQLSAAMRSTMDPDELAALDGTGNAPAAAPAPAADTSLPGTESEAAAGEGNQPAGEGAPDDKGALSAEDAAAALAEAEGGAPTPAPAPAPEVKLPTYDVPSTDFAAKQAELKAQKDAVRDERRAVRAEWVAGKLSDEEWEAKADEFDAKLDQIGEQSLALATEQTRAETVKQINEQNARDAEVRRVNSENAVLNTIATESKAVLAYTGEDGKPTRAAVQFDALLAVARSDPANKDKPFEQIARAVHADVLKLNGIGAPAPSPTPAPAADRSKVPPTLGSMPAAATHVVGDALSQQFDAIDDPDQREAMWARMPASQREAMLRSTLPVTRRH